MSQPAHITPPPAAATEENGHDGSGQLDWAALLSRSVHPTRLWIIEAMRTIERPLSASELEDVFENKQSTSAISYHLNTLAKMGIVRQLEMLQVRGAWKRLYVFTAAVKPAE
jgi:DNA-binding transcriptional ArsR family regulator